MQTKWITKQTFILLNENIFAQWINSHLCVVYFILSIYFLRICKRLNSTACPSQTQHWTNTDLYKWILIWCKYAQRILLCWLQFQVFRCAITPFRILEMTFSAKLQRWFNKRFFCKTCFGNAWHRKGFLSQLKLKAWKLPDEEQRSPLHQEHV